MANKSILDMKPEEFEGSDEQEVKGKLKVDEYLAQIKALEQERMSWEGVWTEIRDNISPEIAAALNGDGNLNDGSNKQGKNLASDPQLAVRTLAAGMQGGLVSPSRMWFSLGVKGRAGTLATSVQNWLDVVRDILLYFFNEADIYGAMYKLFGEMALFGQGVILIEYDEVTGFRFTTLSCGDYWLDTNHKDEVDTLMRKTYYSARGLIEKYGAGKLPEYIIDEADEERSVEKKYEVIQIVQPRKSRNITKEERSEDMAWESVHIFKEGGRDGRIDESRILKVGGFREKPFVAPRWEKIIGRVYGTCPARVALPDVKMLYQIVHEGVTGFQKSVSPPVVATGKMKRGAQVRLVPNGVTYADQLNQNAQIAPIYQPKDPLSQAILLQDRLVASIRAVFYNDLFSTITNRDKTMSATEVTSVNAEKLSRITPVIELLEKEALDYIFDRCFSILMNIGDVIPPYPPELGGAEIKIDYVSVLAQAQRMSEIKGIQQFLEGISVAGKLNMESLDLIDFDKIITETADILCQQNLLKDPKQVKKARKARMQQMQEAKESQQMQQAIPAMKEASEINTDGIHNLAEMMGMA